MSKIKNCPCSHKSQAIDILYKNEHNKKEKINFECTSHNFQNSKNWKPTLYKCRLCSLVFSEYINLKFENNYKNVKDIEYLNQSKFKKQTFIFFIEKIKRYLNKKCSVLEIGSYYGVLAQLVQPIVKEYIGLELSKHASMYSRKNLKLNIINKSFIEYSKSDKKFDIILMTDVIEHVDDPFILLSLIEKKLKKNGKLILSTFNFDSFFAFITGKYYPWIIPMHKYYFSSDTLSNILKKNNLDLIETENDTRVISLEYLLKKLNLLVPYLSFIFIFILKFDFIKKVRVKINLYDLKIYIAEKKIKK